jgi:hypothetical protein
MRKNIVLIVVLMFTAGFCTALVNPASPSSSTTENSWISRAPMHVARGGLGVAVVNDKIYAIGGSSITGTYGAFTGEIVGTNEEYNPATDTWTTKKPMPTPRYGFATTVFNNKIYCIGGENGASYTGANEVYDPATDTWETRTPSSNPRYGISANVVGNEIYVMGGAANGKFSTINEVYNPANDSWSTKEPLPASACDYASGVFEGRIYIIQSASVQIYNVENDTWGQGAAPLANIETGRAGQTSGVNAPERIYVLGWDSGVNQVYDPKLDTWAFGANAPANVGGFGVAVVDDLLYLIGGSSASYKQTIPATSPLAAIFTKHSAVEMYTPMGYGSVSPVVQFVSLENTTEYSATDIPLDFTLNKPVSWMGYSLDGGDNVTVSGNTTLSGLAVGSHSLTVYANDTFGNTGASETVTFNVASPFPTVPVAVASGASITAIAIGLVVYFKKRKSHISVVKKF